MSTIPQVKERAITDISLFRALAKAESPSTLGSVLADYGLALTSDELQDLYTLIKTTSVNVTAQELVEIFDWLTGAKPYVAIGEPFWRTGPGPKPPVR
jgi:hypothetical protein